MKMMDRRPEMPVAGMAWKTLKLLTAMAACTVGSAIRNYSNMAWELFADPELQEMFAALAPGNYARSTLPYETIETYAQLHDHRVKLRRLKDGCVKVQLV